MAKKGKVQLKGPSQYTIKGSDTTIQVGEAVLVRPAQKKLPPFVGRVEGFVPPRKPGGGTLVRLRWYYRPEEVSGGRRPFHGRKELMFSDHEDVVEADTVDGKCTVHSYRAYSKLGQVGEDEFFTRFDYQARTGAFNPDTVAVYCLCELPHNPDELMLNCDSCKDWFHPSCIKLSVAEVKGLDSYVCDACKSKAKTAAAAAAPAAAAAGPPPPSGDEKKAEAPPTSPNSQSSEQSIITISSKRRKR